MALKSDAQGFLVGDPIVLGNALKDWAAIREDVRAIRRALTAGAPAMPKSSEQGRKFPTAAVHPATPQTGGKGAHPYVTRKLPSWRGKQWLLSVRQARPRSTLRRCRPPETRAGASCPVARRKVLPVAWPRYPRGFTCPARHGKPHRWRNSEFGRRR